MTKKAPAQSCPAYVCKAIKKIFQKQGWALHKMSGRYAPFCNTQTGTEGFSVRKVGCSKSVSISYTAAYSNSTTKPLDKEFRKAKEAEAIALLKELGYRLDEHGWITCDHYDFNDH